MGFYYKHIIDNINDIYNVLIEKVLKLYNKCFPLLDVKTRINKSKSPWGIVHIDSKK